MKTSKYFLLALAVIGLATSCHDTEWNEVNLKEGSEAWGNKYLEETNLKTIAEVKALFANEINNNGLKLVKDPMQIKAVVVGNDEGGNIYNSIYLQDGTGGIAVSIAQSGLYGPFCIGQEVLVELQGLYVGAYGKQPQIGTTYTNPNKEGATPQVGRMSRYVWQNHYKLLTESIFVDLDPNVKEVNWNFNMLDLAKDCGTLVKLKGVRLAEADGKAVFAPSDGSVSLTSNCANRIIEGVSNVVVRTSTYADFANQAMPTDIVDITGVATRFNDTWQLLMRTAKDIQKSSTEPAPTSQPQGKGTLDNPYNVAGVTEYTKSLAADKESPKDVYAEGIIVKVSEMDTTGNFGNATYLISDREDGATGSFQVYRGFGLGGEKFNKPGALLLSEGMHVLIKGKVINYKGNTPQFAQGSIIEGVK